MSKSRNLATLLGSDGSVKTTKYVDEKGGVAEFVASGILPNGTPVVLKDDGTVEAISIIGTPESIPAGSVVFHNGITQYTAVAVNPNNPNQIVLSYLGTQGTCVLGTVSGQTITFGAEFTFINDFDFVNIEFVPNQANKFLLCYESSNDNGRCRVATISGNTITYGTEVQFAPNMYKSRFAFDLASNSGKFVVTYRDNPSTYDGKAVVGTVSGDSITFGSAVAFLANTTINDAIIAFDPSTSGSFVVSYIDWYDTQRGSVVAGTVTGTSITFGTPVSMGLNLQFLELKFDPNNAGKCLSLYGDKNNSFYGTAVICTVSSNSISLGSATVFNSGNTDNIKAVFKYFLLTRQIEYP